MSHICLPPHVGPVPYRMVLLVVFKGMNKVFVWSIGGLVGYLLYKNVLTPKTTVCLSSYTFHGHVRYLTTKLILAVLKSTVIVYLLVPLVHSFKLLTMCLVILGLTEQKC